MRKLCTRAVLLVLAAGLLASCGGAAVPPTAAKAGAAQEEATTAEGALAAFDVAERDLARALGLPAPPAMAELDRKVDGGAPKGGFAQAPGAEPPPPPPPSPRPSPPADQHQAQQGPLPAQPSSMPIAPAPTTNADLPRSVSRPADRDRAKLEREGPRAADACSVACSALASMERAAEHLCGLAGAADGRCQVARERVKSASTRVHAACPACSG